MAYERRIARGRQKAADAAVYRGPDQAILMQQTDLTLRESFDILKNDAAGAAEPFPGQG